MIKELEGIVVSMRDYREHDAIVNVYCMDVGLQAFVARGLRKMTSKNAAATQVFTYARFFVEYHEGKRMHALRTADILSSNRALREDLLKQAIASMLCECMEKIDMEEHENAFSLLKTCLEHLRTTTQPYALLGLFISLMNRMNGIEPYVDSCVSCGKTQDIVAISVGQGGFLCKHCFNPQVAITYNKDELKCFRLLCKAELVQFDILETYQEWTYEHFMMVYRFFEEYSGIRLKSMRFLTCLQTL